MVSTGNYRGYVGRWEVFDRRLFLTGLVGGMWQIPERLIGRLPPDPDPFRPAPPDAKTLRLHDLFPDLAPLVPASWFTGRLVVPTGPMEIYVHHGFGSLYASYRLLYVFQGRIASERRMSGRDWARRNGQVWPDERWFEANERTPVPALVFPAPGSDADRTRREDRRRAETEAQRANRLHWEERAREAIRERAGWYHWSDVPSSGPRHFYYMDDQLRALEASCGVRPTGRERWPDARALVRALARRVDVRAEAEAAKRRARAYEEERRRAKEQWGRSAPAD